MKNSIYSLLVLLLAVFLFSCEENNNEIEIQQTFFGAVKNYLADEQYANQIEDKSITFSVGNDDLAIVLNTIEKLAIKYGFQADSILPLEIIKNVNSNRSQCKTRYIIYQISETKVCIGTISDCTEDGGVQSDFTCFEDPS